MAYNNREMIVPNQTIGIIGGGQLGRMMAFSAKAMGYQVGILDPQENCPASQVSDWHIKAAYNDLLAMKQLGEKCDVVTYEFENIDASSLSAITSLTKVPQGVALLKITQDREQEKGFLSEHAFPVANYQIVKTNEELARAVEAIDFPCVLKTTRGGYDGHGQVVLKDEKNIVVAEELLLSGPCIVEEWLKFQLELSVLVGRNHEGELSVLPVSENKHQQNILHQSIVPGRISEMVTLEAQRVAMEIAYELQLEGILCIEFFLDEKGQLYVNELAPRPHNSGHYSIEACDFSQFDIHILSICNRPLPQVRLLSPAIMLNILGQHIPKILKEMVTEPNWHVHFYGKDQAIVNRKMGHLTILSDDVESSLEALNKKTW